MRELTERSTKLIASETDSSSDILTGLALTVVYTKSHLGWLGSVHVPQSCCFKKSVGNGRQCRAELHQEGFLW